MPNSLPVMAETAVCVAHLAEQCRDVPTLAPLLAQFCKVDELTVRDWLAGERLPVGENMIRLRVFLKLGGYRVDELDAVPEKVVNLAMLIAFDVFTPEDVRQSLGYAQMNDVYRVILNGNNTTNERARKIDIIVQTHDEALKKMVPMWENRLRDLLRPEDRSSSASADSPGLDDQRNKGRPKVDPRVIRHLVAALNAALQNPSELPEDRLVAITAAVPLNEVQELISKLEVLR